MHDIVGTVIDVKNFYGNKKAEVQFKNGLNKTKLFSLNENRVYRIPYFQREIRWNKENLIELINDIENNSKFLGNVIFTQDDDGNFDILDGQQRSTVILMLIQYIKYKYKTRIPVFEICDFQVCSFRAFSILFNNNFDLTKFTQSELENIHKTDDYKQIQKYIDLWNEIANHKALQTVADAESFLKNLVNSEINVIVSTGNQDNSIEYFLDVNLKGVQLDREDIFKGYLCAQDNSDEIHEIWSSIKKLDAKLNEETKVDYPFMNILEHYFKCTLCKEDNYKDIDFNEEFKLKNEKEIEGKRYSAGEHIVKVIHNKDYLRECLSEFKQLMEVIVNIANEPSPTTTFNSFFKEFNLNHKNDKIDSDEIAVIYNLLKKIVLDQNRVPKCLVVKYLVNVLIGKSVEKEEYQYIYSIFAASMMFILFETKKGSEKIYRIVKSKQWNIEVAKFVHNYFLIDELANRQITANYKYIDSGRNPDKAEKQEFRCKSIATIFNFLNISSEKVSVKKHKMKELCLFLNDSEKFSVEHFILNESGVCKIELNNGIKFEYLYPDEIEKYKYSLFNYIFISRENNSFLANKTVNDKIKIIKQEEDGRFKNESCEYSRKVIEIIHKDLEIPDVSFKKDEKEAASELDRYYKMDFRNRFASYATEIIKVITNKR